VENQPANILGNAGRNALFSGEPFTAARERCFEAWHCRIERGALTRRVQPSRCLVCQKGLTAVFPWGGSTRWPNAFFWRQGDFVQDGTQRRSEKAHRSLEVKMPSRKIESLGESQKQTEGYPPGSDSANLRGRDGLVGEKSHLR